MDKLNLTLNGNKITIDQVKGQPYLFSIVVNGTFDGYYDITGEFTRYSRLTPEEIISVEHEIKKNYSSKS